jgi:hypothetical protein
MQPQLLIRDVVDWTKMGRGKEQQFFATDAEVTHWMDAELIEDYAPYGMVVVTPERLSTGKYIQEPVVYPVSELWNQLGKREQHSFWLYSKVLSTVNFSPEEKNNNLVDRICALNGFILIQHGARLAAPLFYGKQDCSRIAIVEKIVNTSSGQTQTLSHKPYYAIYKRLRKAIRKALIYSTIQRFSDGHEEEDRSCQLMTKQAYEEANNGFPFRNSPGRLLRS